MAPATTNPSQATHTVYPPPAPAIPKTPAPAPAPPIAPVPPERTLIGGAVPVPTTMGQLFLFLLALWLAFGVMLLILAQFSSILSIAAQVMFLVTTFEITRQGWKVLRARQHVLRAKNISLLWGLVHLIAWDPVEGVLFLRNKSLGFCDDDLNDGHGGIRFCYPILGEELALRVPLEVQTLRFSDEKVLTREYLAVMVRGSMKWRIVDIKKFYLLVGRELRTTGEVSTPHGGDSFQQRQRNRNAPSTEQVDPDDTTNELLVTAIEWLRLFAEEQTRLVISRVSSGLLIADRLSSEMPEVKTALLQAGAGQSAAASPPEWTGAADGLARTIYQTIASRVNDYGIQVDDVTLQEIRLPQDVVDECAKACKMAYLPLMAQRQASVKRADLAAQVELLGREAVGTREIVGAAPGFTLVDFVSSFLTKRLSDHGGVGLTATTMGALTAGVTTGVIGLPAPAQVSASPPAPPEPPSTPSQGA